MSILVTINFIKKQNVYEELIDYLYSLSEQIGFVTFHKYHLNDETIDNLLASYRKEHLDEVSTYRKLYYENDKEFIKQVKKIKIKNDEMFEEYLQFILQHNFELCKKLEKNCNILNENKTTLDYKDVFLELAPYLFSVTPDYTIDCEIYDLVKYQKNELLLNAIKQMESFSAFPFINDKYNIYFESPAFFRNNHEFAKISTEHDYMEIIFEENEYQIFKKMKIKHKTEEFIWKDEKQ